MGGGGDGGKLKKEKLEKETRKRWGAHTHMQPLNRWPSASWNNLFLPSGAPRLKLMANFMGLISEMMSSWCRGVRPHWEQNDSNQLRTTQVNTFYPGWSFYFDCTETYADLMDLCNCSFFSNRSRINSLLLPSPWRLLKTPHHLLLTRSSMFWKLFNEKVFVATRDGAGRKSWADVFKAGPRWWVSNAFRGGFVDLALFISGTHVPLPWEDCCCPQKNVVRVDKSKEARVLDLLRGVHSFWRLNSEIREDLIIKASQLKQLTPTICCGFAFCCVCVCVCFCAFIFNEHLWLEAHHCVVSARQDSLVVSDHVLVVTLV